MVNPLSNNAAAYTPIHRGTSPATFAATATLIKTKPDDRNTCISSQKRKEEPHTPRSVHDGVKMLPKPTALHAGDNVAARRHEFEGKISSTRTDVGKMTDGKAIDARSSPMLRVNASSRRSSWSPGDPSLETTSRASALPSVQPTSEVPEGYEKQRQRGRGFYIPPPGYQATPPASRMDGSQPSGPSGDRHGRHSNQQGPPAADSCNPDRPLRWQHPGEGYVNRPPKNWRPAFDPELGQATEKYGGHGEWHPLRDSGGTTFEWLPNLRTDAAGFNKVQDIFARLVHSDWNIPQAQRVLSTWATLATLLAGTQTTLLTFYERDKTAPYIALSFAALFLEIYGALLAAVNIMISISLQASQTSQQQQGADQQSEEANLRISQGFKWQWTGPPEPYSTSTASASSIHPSSIQQSNNRIRTLNPVDRETNTAICVLDRLTVSCGIIIPLGGLLELTGLTVYAVQTHSGPAVWGLSAAIGFALFMTILGIGQGLHSGRRPFREEIRYRKDKKSTVNVPTSKKDWLPLHRDSRTPRGVDLDRHRSNGSFSSSQSSHQGIRRPNYDIGEEDEDDQDDPLKALMNGTVLKAVVVGA